MIQKLIGITFLCLVLTLVSNPGGSVDDEEDYHPTIIVIALLLTPPLQVVDNALIIAQKSTDAMLSTSQRSLPLLTGDAMGSGDLSSSMVLSYEPAVTVPTMPLKLLIQNMLKLINNQHVGQD